MFGKVNEGAKEKGKYINKYMNNYTNEQINLKINNLTWKMENKMGHYINRGIYMQKKWNRKLHGKFNIGIFAILIYLLSHLFMFVCMYLFIYFRFWQFQSSIRDTGYD